MENLQQISSQSDYNKKASSFSKLIIAVFFIAYVYVVFTAGGNAGGWLGPMIFLVIGLFASSIFIAAPLYVLIRLFPRFSMAVTILSIILTFLITKLTFIWLFA